VRGRDASRVEETNPGAPPLKHAEYKPGIGAFG
jgi:hypothetical protein